MTDDFLRRWSRKKSDANKTLRRKTDEYSSEPNIKPAAEEEHLSDRQFQVSEVQPDNADLIQLNESKSDANSEEIINSESDQSLEKKEESDFEEIDFEALSYESDYTQFMGEGVPEVIQRKALRKLWASNPILANVDGLNDYDDDFTDAALAVGVIKTAYKVGSGYLTEDEQVEYGMIEKESSDLDGEGELDSAEPPKTQVATDANGQVDHEEKEQLDHEENGSDLENQDQVETVRDPSVSLKENLT